MYVVVSFILAKTKNLGSDMATKNSVLVNSKAHHSAVL